METQLRERQHRRDPHQNQYIPLPHPHSVGEGSFLYMCLLNDMKTVEFFFPQNQTFSNSCITFLQNKTFNNSHTHLLVATHASIINILALVCIHNLGCKRKKIRTASQKKKRKQVTAHEEKNKYPGPKLSPPPIKIMGDSLTKHVGHLKSRITM